MKVSRSTHLYLTVALFFMGLFAVIQFRTYQQVERAALARSTVDQGQIISDLIDANSTLRREVDDLRTQVFRYELDSERGEIGALLGDLNAVQVLNGLVETAGPGVEVRVDSELAVADMQDLINELRNAGAEAIAVNERRIVARSVVARGKKGLLIDGIEIGPPYILKAIGSTQTLERALERKGGLVQLLRYSESRGPILVSRMNNLVVPAYGQAPRLTYAKPADQ